MLEYLNKAISERALFVRTAYERECDLHPNPKRHRYADVDMALSRAIPEELSELYDEYINLGVELEIAESNATYRAGWLDGIVVGVLAATQGDNRAQ